MYFNQKRMLKYYIILTCVFFITFLLLYKHSSNTHNDDEFDFLGRNPPVVAKKDTAELGLYLRTFHKKKNLYDNILARSMRYFWPHKNVSITVVLDDESPEDHDFGNDIENRYPYPNVLYEPEVEPRVYGYYGHYRQQRNMFYAEQYTNYKYVGFLDTDTMFVTTVHHDTMFENGKPIIIGQFGKKMNWYWSEIGQGTIAMFNSKEIMRCMSYFPVIIKVEHLVALRRHVQKTHKVPFDEVFAKISPRGRFSQFNLMCQYIWLYHRDEYVFRLQSRSDGNWQGEDNSPFRQPFEFYQKTFTIEQTRPAVRSSIHYRYHKNFKNESTYRDLLSRGLCFSGGFDLCEELCKQYDQNSTHRELFQFEFSDWIWDSRCLSAQDKHYKKVKADMKADDRERIRRGCYEVGHIPFKL